MIEAGVKCQECYKLTKTIVYRKGFLSDDAFCSKECLVKHVTRNIEFREREFDPEIDLRDEQ